MSEIQLPLLIRASGRDRPRLIGLGQLRRARGDELDGDALFLEMAQ